MVDHDRALDIAESSLNLLIRALDNDTQDHEEEWPGDPEIIGSEREERIKQIRYLLEKVGNQINTIDHYNVY